jgi:hypothetical protein
MGKTYQSTTVNAPTDQVWNTIRNFHDMSWASSVITQCVPVGDLGGDQVGAKRVLNDAFHETLHDLNTVDHSIRYSIADGPALLNEVDEYIGLLRVSPITDTNTSYVEWSSTWSGKDQETAKCSSPIYVALLADLKSNFK